MSESARSQTEYDVIVAGAEQTHEHALHHAAIAVGLDPGQLTAHSEPLVWIEVTAAAPGVVETLAVTDGSFVEEAGLVLTTVQPDRLRFRALALQADLPRLSGEPRARLRGHRQKKEKQAMSNKNH